MQQSQELVKAIFDEHFKSLLYSLTFHLLEYVMENIESFGSLEMLAGPFS